MSKRKYIGGRDKDKELSPLQFILRCLVFVLIFSFIYLLISLALTAFLYTTANPTKNIYIFSLVCGCVSSFLSGFIFSKINGQKWLLSGVLLGGITVFFIFLIGLLFPNDTKSYLQYALIPVFCILGAFLGKKRVKQRKHLKRR